MLYGVWKCCDYADVVLVDVEEFIGQLIDDLPQKYASHLERIC